MSEVLFSICHTTARPEGWQDSYRVWMDNAACPETVEYILTVDERWGFTSLPEFHWDPRRGELRKGIDRAVWNTGRKCLVDGANIAAANAFGKILIINSDDFFPVRHWDTKLLAAISQNFSLAGAVDQDTLDRDFVVRTSPGAKYQAWLDEWVKQGRGDLVGRLMTLQILSRARYQRFGYALYPEFTSMMADTDFTDAAEHDGVVIEARHIEIEHRHPFVTPGASQDSVSKHENEMAAHELGARIFARRHAERSGLKLVPVQKAAEQIDGWMTQYELTWLASHAAEMREVLEVGSWKGRSTFALASACNGPVYALDHWEGSRDDFRISPELGHKAFAEFLQNVGHFPNLRVIRADSTKYEPESSDFRIDMAFIDGCHAYEDVLIDIRKWRGRARRLICGHDINLPDVARAVAEEFGDSVHYGAGSIWFVWMDGTVEEDSSARTKIETLAVCFPGSNYDWRVHEANNVLSVNLASRFDLFVIFQACSNQYIVRDLCSSAMRNSLKQAGRKPKYVLWRDSDNVLTDSGFDLLYDALESAPQISAIGGWYYRNPTEVCAANLDTNGVETWLKFEEIQAAADSLKLIEVSGQIGFGALLMRWEVMEGSGEWPFSPIVAPSGQYMGDDVSFIRRSMARGHRWFLHPEVYLPHYKMDDIPAPRLKISDRDVVDVPQLANAAD